MLLEAERENLPVLRYPAGRIKVLGTAYSLYFQSTYIHFSHNCAFFILKSKVK